MTNNDWYYQPQDDRAWDAFVDYCDRNDLDIEEEDFDEWLAEEEDRRDDALISAAEYARENPDEGY